MDSIIEFDPSVRKSIIHVLIIALGFPINQEVEILIYPPVQNDSRDIRQFFSEFTEEPGIQSQLLNAASANFNPIINDLDSQTFDTSEKVIVEKLNVLRFKDVPINLLDSSCMLSPISMSPSSTTTYDHDDFDYEINVSTSTSAPTPLPSPTVNQVVEKAKYHVDKMKKKHNLRKRGRPAVTCDSDLNDKINELNQKPKRESKDIRVVKNNLASRKYRRNLSDKRSKIDKDLANELARYHYLMAQHKKYEEDNLKLQRMMHA